MNDPEILEKFLQKTLADSPTFSDEMMRKVREELLNAGRQAAEHYTKKTETETVSVQG